MEILDYLETFINNTPILGHAKGFLHYNMGEKEKGNQAMKSSTRSTCTVIGATIGLGSTVNSVGIVKLVCTSGLGGVIGGIVGDILIGGVTGK